MMIPGTGKDDTNCLYRKIELKDDFTYPIATTGIEISDDSRHMVTLGVYKPSVHFYDLKNRTLIYEKHLISDGIKVQIISDDGKFSVLRRDKNIEFHTRSGLQKTLKINTQPTDMVFSKTVSELYSCTKDQIYRLDLEQGRYKESIEIENIEKIDVCRRNGILVGSGEYGIMFIDTRNSEVFKRLPISNISNCAISECGYKYCISKENSIYEYDIRSNNIFSENTENSEIVRIRYNGTDLSYSTNKEIKIINEKINILPGYKINDYDINGKMIFVGGEDSEIKGYLLENE